MIVPYLDVTLSCCFIVLRNQRGVSLGAPLATGHPPGQGIFHVLVTGAKAEPGSGIHQSVHM